MQTIEFMGDVTLFVGGILVIWSITFALLTVFLKPKKGMKNGECNE